MTVPKIICTNGKINDSTKSNMYQMKMTVSKILLYTNGYAYEQSGFSLSEWLEAKDLATRPHVQY